MFRRHLCQGKEVRIRREGGENVRRDGEIEVGGMGRFVTNEGQGGDGK